MLSKLYIRNFQKHGKIRITLDPKITVITGDTDKGKSSLIRALRWLVFNRPNSSSFFKHGTKHCRVSALFDGKKITRQKGKENTYAINKKKFKAIGGDVPEEVNSLLRITETNFQLQFDPLFWITDSPGQISKNLNKIIDLESIDKATRIASRQYSEAKSYLKVYSSKHKEKQEKRKELEWFLEAEAELEAIEESTERLEKDRAAAAHLRDLIGACRLARVRHRNATQAVSEAQEWQEQLTQLAHLNTRYELVSKLTNRLKKLRMQSLHSKIKLEKAEKKLKKMRKGKCPICNNPMS